jgi:predicted TIM-barrel fold metal-dependent hydrolase
MEEYRKHPNADEVAIEPDLPIVDAHHHLWTDPPVPFLPSYDAPAYEADLRASGHNIIATVYVDSHSNYREDGPEHLRVVGETEHCERVAEDAVRRGPGAIKLCSAIVSTTNMMLGEAVGEVLDAHMAASPRFRGIRQLITPPPNVEFQVADYGPNPMGSPEFLAAFRELERRNLSFEGRFKVNETDQLLALAKACPGARVVVVHGGGAGFLMDLPEPQRSEAFERWRETMRTFAELDNVFMKLGGLNQNYSGLSPAVASLWDSAFLAQRHGPYLRAAIEAFGPDRCMFESNFPVDGVFTSMTTVWNVFKRVSSDFSESERADMFVNTARRVYRF